MKLSNLPKQILVLAILLFLAIFLTACEPTTTPVPPAQATRNAIYMATFNACTLPGNFTGASIGQQILESKDIFKGEIVKSQTLIWNSADGKAPVDPRCIAEIFPYTPVEVHVTESYKGTLKPGDTVRLLVEGSPRFQKFLDYYSFYPGIGDSNIWFLGENKDYRVGNPVNPLVYPRIVESFSQIGKNEWMSRIQLTIFNDTNQLKEFIKNPPITPTPMNFTK